MKPHIIAICTAIFVIGTLLLGVRAGIIAPVCFFAGMSVKEKEQAVVAQFDRLKSRVMGWFAA